MPFYDDPLRLRDFAKALEQAELADENDVLKKPYKFESEYEAWADNGFPTQEDPEWDSFIDALNALESEEESNDG